MFVLGATIVCSSAYVYSMKPSSEVSSLSTSSSVDKLPSSSSSSQQKEEEKEGLLAESEMTNNITPRNSREKL